MSKDKKNVVERISKKETNFDEKEKDDIITVNDNKSSDKFDKSYSLLTTEDEEKINKVLAEKKKKRYKVFFRRIAFWINNNWTTNKSDIEKTNHIDDESNKKIDFSSFILLIVAGGAVFNFINKLNEKIIIPSVKILFLKIKKKNNWKIWNKIKSNYLFRNIFISLWKFIKLFFYFLKWIMLVGPLIIIFQRLGFIGSDWSIFVFFWSLFFIYFLFTFCY